MSDPFIIDAAGPVARITLNRPQRLNALSDPLAAELACALRGFDDDPGISVIVVTGNEKAQLPVPYVVVAPIVSVIRTVQLLPTCW